MAYLQAARRFFAWCELEQIGQLADIEPLRRRLHRAAWREFRKADREIAPGRHPKTVRLAGGRSDSGDQPAHAVRGPTHVVKTGKTTVLDAYRAQLLLDSIPLTRTVKASDGAPSE